MDQIAVQSRALPVALENFDRLPASAFVNVHVVCGVYGRSKAAVWRDIASGRVPRPHKFGRASRWNVGELRAALEAALAGGKA